MTYTIRTIETAPAPAKETLAAARKAYGFLPNLLGMITASPALVKAYTTVAALFEETSFTPAEQQTVLHRVSAENNYEYCVAAHSVIAAIQKAPYDVVQAIRDRKPIPDTKLEALRCFTTAIVKTRGWPTNENTKAFLDAGYSRAQVLDVVLGVGLKTLSNYANHIGDTPLDQAFAKSAWSRAA